jgi:hypothetical protein
MRLFFNGILGGVIIRGQRRLSAEHPLQEGMQGGERKRCLDRPQRGACGHQVVMPTPDVLTF